MHIFIPIHKLTKKQQDFIYQQKRGACSRAYLEDHYLVAYKLDKVPSITLIHKQTLAAPLSALSWMKRKDYTSQEDVELFLFAWALGEEIAHNLLTPIGR